MKVLGTICSIIWQNLWRTVMTSAGRPPKKVVLSSCVKWKTTKFNGRILKKIDRFRQVHAQRVAPVSKNKRGTSKFRQRGSCMQKGDHENNGQLYLHVCQHCYTQGKSHSHPGKVCENK